MKHDPAWSNEQSLALHEAARKLYALIADTEHMVGERRPTKAILKQFQKLKAQANEVYTQASLQEIALYEVTQILKEVREDYDQLLVDTETAFAYGMQAGLDAMSGYTPMDEEEREALIQRYREANDEM